MKKLRLYLGYDGSYVLSKYKLKKFKDVENDYLATGRKHSCVDISESDMRILLGRRKPLKMWEVVRLEITVK